MKKISLLSGLFIILFANLYCQNVGDMVSVTSGNWSDTGIWRYWDGFMWTSVPGVPGSSYETITIKNGHTVTVDNGVNIDQTIVEEGGTLILSGSTYISINNGNGDDLTVNGTLSVSGGSLEGSGNVVVNNIFNWSGGTITVYTTQISTGAYLNISGSSSKVFRYSGGTIYNSGTITWTGTGSILGASNKFENQASGVFDIQSDTGIYYDNGGGSHLIFNNSGTVKKSAGTGTCTFYHCPLNNTGTVLVESGNLQLGDGGTSTGSFTISEGKMLEIINSGCIFNEGCVVNGNGALLQNSGDISCNGTSTGMIFDSGITYDYNGGTLSGSGKLTINGTMNWSSTGSVTINSLIIPAGSYLNITGNSNKSFRYSGGSIYNSGTITWTGSGNLNGASNYIRNLPGSVFDIQNDAGIYYDNGGGGYLTFINDGILKKTSGTGTSTFYQCILTNNSELNIDTGTFQLGGGGTFSGPVNLSGGSVFEIVNSQVNLSEGFRLNGNGTFTQSSGNISVDGTSSGTVFESGITYNYNGGELGGSGKLYINGTMNWSSSSTLSIPFISISADGFFNISGDSNKRPRYDGYIYNYGTATWTGAGSLVGASHRIHNMEGAVFEIKNDAGIYYDYGGGGYITIENSGTMKKSAGTGTTDFNQAYFSNPGELTVETGTLRIGYSLSNYSSNTLTGGKFTIYGTLKIPDGNIYTNSSNLTLSGTPAQILRTSDDFNALTNLSTNSASGILTLRNGRDLAVSGSFTNSGILDMAENILSGPGDFTNSAGSTLRSGSTGGISSTGTTGNVQFGGTRTFNSDASYTYNGVSAQITGTGLPSNVKNLTVWNNSGVNLTNSVTVSGNLNMNYGVLSTGSFSVTLGTATSALGTLNRVYGYINGNFKRWLSASTDNVLFPVGTNSIYRPVDLNFTAPPGTGGTLTASFVTADPGENGLPVTDGSDNIDQVCSDGFWTLSADNGLTGGVYDIDLYADGFGGISDFTSLHIIKRADQSSPWVIEGTHSEATGSNSSPVLHRTGLTAFSHFAAGSETGGVISAPSVTIQAISGEATLTWPAVTGATSYKVYSSSDPYAEFSLWVLETTVPAPELSWIDEEATEIKKFYVIVAVN